VVQPHLRSRDKMCFAQISGSIVDLLGSYGAVASLRVGSSLAARPRENARMMPISALRMSSLMSMTNLSAAARRGACTLCGKKRSNLEASGW
jgi:hypothetical protein